MAEISFDDIPIAANQKPAKSGLSFDDIPMIEQAPLQYGDQSVNIGAKGRMAPGSRVRPNLNAALAQGATLGASDEIIGGIAAPLQSAVNAITGEGPTSLSENFQQAKALEDAKIAATRDQFPKTAFAGELAGGIVAGGPAAKFVAKGASALGKTVRGGVAGAGYGAAQGFAGSEGNVDERLDGAQSGAAWGAGFGVAGDRAARLAGRAVERLRRSKVIKQLPTVSNLKQKSKELYDAADSAGLHISKQAVDRFKSNMSRILDDEGFEPENFPEIVNALRRIERIATFNPSLRKMDAARRSLKKALGSANDEDVRMAMLVKSGMDDFMENLQPQDITSGDPRAAVGFLSEARKVWSQARKTDTLETLMDRARRRAARTGSGANIDNVIRQELDKIINSRTLSKGFSDEELAAMRAIVEGSKTANVARRIGKAAPTGVVSGGLGSGAGALIGNAVAGPFGAAVGGAAVPIAGSVAKSVADKSTINAANRVLQTIRNGGPLRVKNAAQLESLIRRLAVSQGGQPALAGQ